MAFAYSGISPAILKPSCESLCSNDSEDVVDPNDALRIIWLKFQLTGLDLEKDQIIEAAVLITDEKLRLVAEGPNFCIHQPDEVMQNMNDWCAFQHRESGLVEDVRRSQVSLNDAEYQILSFIRELTPREECPLAGNSVHIDRRFVEKYMPQVAAHLHYRNIDVSTFKECCTRWFPCVFRPNKKRKVRALCDLLDSIHELTFYRNVIFRNPAYFE